MIFDCFKKDQPRAKKPSVQLPKPIGSYFKIKIAIIVGHNKRSPGATNYLGESEYVFNSRIAKKLQEKLAAIGIDSVIIFRPSGVGYSKEVQSVVKQLKIHGVTHCICLHFNDASGSPLGCEVLVAPTSTKEDNRWGDIITDMLNEKYGFKERHDDGVKTVKRGHGGYGMLSALSDEGYIAVLPEPCFAGYKNKESELIFENEDRYVDVLRDSFAELVKEKESLPELKYKWNRLIEIYEHAVIEFPGLKSITLAQWIKESGRGTSKLALEHNNFAGLKWRKEMRGYAMPVIYDAHDGITEYCKFESLESFIRGYWKFLERSPYKGWHEFAHRPIEFMKFIGPTYCPNDGYVDDVLKLLPEAQRLLK